MKRYFVQHALLVLLSGLLIMLTGCAFLTTEQRSQVDELHEDTLKTIVRVESKTENTPESALNDSLIALQTILAYTEEVINDPAGFNAATMENYDLKIRIINENINRIKDLTLATDISFPRGTYKLFNISRDAQDRLDELSMTVAKTIVELSSQYSDHTINLIVKTVGYTDQTVVLANTQLAEKITAELAGDEIPKGRVERRKTFNRVLSSYRAESLTKYIVQQVTKEIGSTHTFTVEKIVIGKGEEQPGKKGRKPYSAKDKRRRVCVVSPFVEVVP